MNKNKESLLSVDIPMLKKQFHAVLLAQKRKGTSKRMDTLLEGVLNFFDDLIIDAGDSDRLEIHLEPDHVRAKKLFLLQVLDDIEPVVHGPYSSEVARLAAARHFRRDRGMRDGLFMLDCADEPEPACFGASELEGRQ